MKKILSTLLVAVCLFMAMPAQAQFHFGLKGGLDVSKVQFSSDLFKGDNATDSLSVRWLNLHCLL